MTRTRLLAPEPPGLAARRQHGAMSLAQRLPQLVIAAREVASTVRHGVHGRRRAGVGETFWQFRPFHTGESAARVDWRRSARDHRLYVREREWESAHTAMIFIDRSPSMAFVSDLSQTSKLDRAIVLGLAAADLLVRGGERVGMPGLMRPVAARGVVQRMAEAMLAQERLRPALAAADLPPAEPLAPRAQALLIGDFLVPPAAFAETLAGLSGRGAHGHAVMTVDPSEEAFPFAGHAEFLDVDSPARLRVGEARAMREDYLRRYGAHRAAIRDACLARGWSFLVHHTDKPASHALLALRMRLEADTAAPMALAGSA